MSNVEKIQEILRRLYILYPNPKTALNFETPLELLIATILSAQCTDKLVNLVTPGLFAKYRTTQDYANAPVEQLQQDISRVNFYRNKAKLIKAMAQMLVSDFGSQVPKTMEELDSLPGVARKTANVVLGNAFGINDGVVVDTHVSRLSQRLGLTKEKDPVKIERDLMKVVAREEWLNFSHLLIEHGRAICKAPKPKCPDCSLREICPSANKFYPALLDSKTP